MRVLPLTSVLDAHRPGSPTECRPPIPGELAEILKVQCAGDAELRERVEALLRAHRQASALPTEGLRDIRPGLRSAPLSRRPTILQE